MASALHHLSADKHAEPNTEFFYIEKVAFALLNTSSKKDAFSLVSWVYCGTDIDPVSWVYWVGRVLTPAPSTSETGSDCNLKWKIWFYAANFTPFDRTAHMKKSYVIQYDAVVFHRNQTWLAVLRRDPGIEDLGMNNRDILIRCSLVYPPLIKGVCLENPTWPEGPERLKLML
jgi:hypothetical protein